MPGSRAADIPADLQTFRAPVAIFVGLWSAGILTVLGTAAIAVFAAFNRDGLGGADILLAIGAWVLLTIIASGSLAWVLSAGLAAPANTLLALRRIDGEIAPVRRHTLLQSCRDLHEQLIRAAHEKNGQISELARARDNARVDGEALNAFFAGMSHELRTPLNAIMGYATLLSEDAGDAGRDDQVKDLDRILQSSRHLLRLINDILDLTRLDAGEVTVDRSVVDVCATVNLVVAGMTEKADRSGIQITSDIAPNAKVMLGDAARLRQCLTTIISNLLEVHSDRTLRLEVRLVGQAESRIEFRLPDVTGKLSEAVASAAAVDQEYAHGTPPAPLGAALAMTVVRRKAVLMGGALHTERTAEGDAIVLAIPMNAVGGEVEPIPTAAPPVAAPADPDRRGKTVLVIDDDESTIDLLDRWLTRQGYRVIAAPNGPAGLELARTHGPDFIVLDIIMPGQSGYEVLAEIKADATLRNSAVILVSSDDNRRLGLEAGAAEVLVKPLSRKGLNRVLDALGQQARGDILVVDDDEDVREIVERYARQAGFSVRLASNGEEGMALARDLTPGAIILDLCMPESDGFGMIDDLAKDPSLRDVPVMVLSQMDISVAEHARIRHAGHVFHPKWNSSPSQIVENIKSMVAR
ncbi:hypothetical protein GCM10009116_00650 [Brevundimonas basaltis]|uniref:histidine kinase n=1 Tax=Brevundimonas basaltis TaxID=472166 RepID=A0A7W8I1C9_9CAUL|nr:response regulator [Brevundimonas basaltis]MBB5292913.1 DNA-binding response OmpR family regulator/signal transduction histidine kinase [Brevundimonas basaltis]